MRRSAVSAILAACALAAPGAHAAAPDCAAGPAAVRTLASGQGTLESVIVHPNGKLYFTSPESLLRLDRPGAEPVVHTPAEELGGLAIDSDGSIVAGVGNTIANGLEGDQTGPSRLIRIDPVTGKSEPYADGLSMGNGVDRGPDGSFYASNDFGSNIDRVRDGKTERGWAKVESGNGLVVDSSGRYLYVAQTFRPAAIQRVEIANPANVTPFAVAPADDSAAGFDGMDRDDADNLFVAANGAGSIWKVDAQGQMCVLLRGLPPFPDGPSAVAVGVRGSPFPPENLYVVAFNGDLTELAGVARPAAAKLRLRLAPRRVRAGKRKRFRAVVTSSVDGFGVPGARVRLGGRRAVTDQAGRATVAARFRRPGRRTARAARPGYGPAKTTVRVRRR